MSLCSSIFFIIIVENVLLQVIQLCDQLIRSGPLLGLGELLFASSNRNEIT